MFKLGDAVVLRERTLFPYLRAHKDVGTIKQIFFDRTPADYMVAFKDVGEWCFREDILEAKEDAQPTTH